MNTTPPEAKTEYSRAQGAFGRADSGPSDADSRAPSRGSRAAGARDERPAGRVPALIRGSILIGGLLGALLLLVSEFTTLFTVRTSATAAPVSSVATGSHHTYALIPIAALVVLLSIAVYTAVSRPALLAIGLLAILTLLIALLGDLPDAQASGLVGGGAQHYVAASATPSAGLYMETLGGVVLLITSVCGFLLLGPPPRRAPESPPDRKPAPRPRKPQPDPQPAGRRREAPEERRQAAPKEPVKGPVKEPDPEPVEQPAPDRFWFETD
jgi:hypothetical protein